MGMFLPLSGFSVGPRTVSTIQGFPPAFIGTLSIASAGASLPRSPVSVVASLRRSLSAHLSLPSLSHQCRRAAAGRLIVEMSSLWTNSIFRPFKKFNYLDLPVAHGPVGQWIGGPNKGSFFASSPLQMLHPYQAVRCRPVLLGRERDGDTNPQRKDYIIDKHNKLNAPGYIVRAWAHYKQHL